MIQLGHLTGQLPAWQSAFFRFSVVKLVILKRKSETPARVD